MPRNMTDVESRKNWNIQAKRFSEIEARLHNAEQELRQTNDLLLKLQNIIVNKALED